MSDLITGHDKYRYLVGSILGKIGFEDVDAMQVEEQVNALKVVERKEEELKMRDKEQSEKPKEQIGKPKEQIEKPKEQVEKPEEQSEEPKEHLPFEFTSPETSSRPPLAQSSSSRTVVPTESKAKAEPLDALSDSSDDEYVLRNGRITMTDMEKEDALPLPARPAVVQQPAVLIEQMEAFSLKPNIEMSIAKTESDTESLASLPLADMCEVEPLPEPELENERVQFGSSVRGFELTWETR
ncbi:uncharacterized protein BDZ99DRAFT_517024 [Mytilinidion resinicola]|uniref:Uncharacterized protein n=1 Tax=Mytilinidion resinicola TaxID=574789 RepID=A0A6A6Z191_9PEZI|nr:uncharacterized protein BDZ99DRAFT_517024 [Mytilinidion resinicola]KAF2814433.1 hypothetical protein BDZ99DRAFT_517024 [Mytilinidion resinicola]